MYTNTFGGGFDLFNTFQIYKCIFFKSQKSNFLFSFLFLELFTTIYIYIYIYIYMLYIIYIIYIKYIIYIYKTSKYLSFASCFLLFAWLKQQRPLILWVNDTFKYIKSKTQIFFCAIKTLLIHKFLLFLKPIYYSVFQYIFVEK